MYARTPRRSKRKRSVQGSVDIASAISYPVCNNSHRNNAIGLVRQDSGSRPDPVSQYLKHLLVSGQRLQRHCLLLPLFALLAGCRTMAPKGAAKSKEECREWLMQRIGQQDPDDIKCPVCISEERQVRPFYADHKKFRMHLRKVHQCGHWDVPRALACLLHAPAAALGQHRASLPSGYRGDCVPERPHDAHRGGAGVGQHCQRR